MDTAADGFVTSWIPDPELFVSDPDRGKMEKTDK